MGQRGRVVTAGAALLVAGVMRAADGGCFGISPQNPIGAREALEAALRAAGLASRAPEQRRSEDMGGAFRVVAWIDEEASARAGASEHVHLLLGLDGSLRGVTGSFTAPGGSEKVRAFMQHYWGEVAGSPPRFEPQASGSEWTPASETARFSTAGARGTWMRIGGSESIRIRARESAGGPRTP